MTPGRARSTGTRVPTASLITRAGALLLVAALAGCAGSSSPAPSATEAASSTPATPAPTAEPGPIVIGISLSLTGAYSSEVVKQAKYGYDLWAKTVNEAGGILGRQVELKIYDDKSDPAQAARLYEKLITDDKVDLLLGPFSSALSATVATAVEGHNFPTVLGLAGADEIFERGYKNVFMIATPGELYVQGYWDLMKQLGLKTIGLTGEDSSFNQSAYPLWKDQAAAQGFSIVAEELFPPNTTDLTSVVAKMKAANPDVLMDGTYEYDATLLLRGAKAQGFNPKIYAFIAGPTNPDWLANLGADAEYVTGGVSWMPNAKGAGNPEFVAAFKEMYVIEPTYVAAYAYSSGQVLQAAVEGAGSLDLDKIREQLQSLVLPTLSGTYAVKPGGKRTAPEGELAGLYIVQVLNGTPEIIWPADAATAKAVLPVPPWTDR